MSRSRTAWSALALLASLTGACVASTTAPVPDAPPIPAPSPPQANPPPASDTAEAEDPLAAWLPPSIADALDDSARVFACLDYGHVDRIAGLEGLGRQDILERLQGLKAARRLCQPLVHDQFAGFPPLLDAFDAEWLFLLTYLALTAEAQASHNPETACANLRQTVKASRRAVDTTRSYGAWLAHEIALAGREDPFLTDMVRRAEVKITVFTRLSTELTNQYSSECALP